MVFSGSHRQSLRELQQENADIAAIDCVTYALLQRHQPQALAGLVAIGWSPAAPGLPLITAGATPAATLNSLREALQQLVSDARYRPLCDALLICGYSDMPREAYAPLLAWRDEGRGAGSQPAIGKMPRPAVCAGTGHVGLRRGEAVFHRGQTELFTQGAGRVAIAHDAVTLQNRHHLVNKAVKVSRQQREHQVEPIGGARLPGLR